MTGQEEFLYFFEINVQPAVIESFVFEVQLLQALFYLPDQLSLETFQAPDVLGQFCHPKSEHNNPCSILILCEVCDDSLAKLVGLIGDNCKLVVRTSSLTHLHRLLLLTLLLCFCDLLCQFFEKGGRLFLKLFRFGRVI